MDHHTAIPPTTISLPPPKAEHSLGQYIDTTNRASSDSASSNGASPRTPFYDRPFNFLHYQFDEAIDDPTNSNYNGIPSHTKDISANDQKSNQHHHRPSQKNHQRSDTNLMPSTERCDHRVLPPSKKTTMPATPTEDSDCSGDSIAHPNSADHPCPWNRNDVPNQENPNGDTASIASSFSSIDCKDFPNPPSSTPSLVQRLTIKTNIPQQYESTDSATSLPSNNTPYGCRNNINWDFVYRPNKFATQSRFTEVFDIRGTQLDLDYNLNYRRHRATSSPTPSSPVDGGQNTRIGNFISTIGRTVALSSSSLSPPPASPSIKVKKNKKRTLSTSSGSKSIRGLIRSLSTTATNRHQHPVSKHSPKKTEEGITKAAQVVTAATTTTTTAMKNQPILPIEEACSTKDTSTTASIDGQRRQKISSLLFNAILKPPRRHHTTKMVNMAPSPISSAKKLARRTVIYVSPDNQLDMDGFLESIQQQCQNRGSYPTCTASSEHYRLVKKLPPSPSLDNSKSSSSPSTSTSISQSPSSILSDTSSSRSSNSKQKNRKSSCIEGFELREMEDGTIEWGIVMEEGQRKSFYSLMVVQQGNVEDDDKDGPLHFDVDDGGDDKGSGDEQIERREVWVVIHQQLEEKLLSSHYQQLPIIPQRSPKRQLSNALSFRSSTSIVGQPLNHGTTQDICIIQDRKSSSSASSTSTSTESSLSTSTTEIYYADMTLPSLLKIVSQAQKNGGNSNYQV